MTEPSRIAMEAAVDLEIQMACQTITTRGLALHLDKIALALTPSHEAGTQQKQSGLKGRAVDLMAPVFAEIDVWHRLFPRHVSYVTEEARAKVENREPKHRPEPRIG